MTQRTVRFEKANLKNSIYSFNYVSPENRAKKDTIISTNFPGLVELEQVNADNRVAHVKMGNVGSAVMTLSAVGACRGVSFDENGDFYFDRKKADDVFAVNRTYVVDRRFTNGYVANLDLDAVKDQIATQVIKHKEKGFTKEQTFSDTLTNDLDSVMTFEWTEEQTVPTDETGIDKILQIKQSVFAFFIDQYFESLLSGERLVKVEPAKVKPAQGGNVSTTHVGHRCWTEKVLFFRRTRCGNYTYQLTHWKDGITDQEIKKRLDVHFDGVDSMTINKMVPFYYSTAFEK